MPVTTGLELPAASDADADAEPQATAVSTLEPDDPAGTAAEPGVDEEGEATDPPSSRLLGWITLAVVALSTLFVFWQMRPDLLLSNTVPTGGDMGAHVWAPAFLRDELLPKLQLSGWAPDWYAGFPAYHFYMVVPALAIVALDLVLPYGIAFKLIAVAGIVGMPVAAWAFGRLTRLPFPFPALLAAATLPFLFDTHWAIWGGNVASMLAGEFSFAIGLSLAILYFGVLIRSLQDGGRHRGWLAVVLALVVLCHLIPGFFVAGGTVVILGVHLLRDRRAVLRLLPAIATSVLLTAFWALPFFVRRQLTIDMGWEKLDAFGTELFRSGRLNWAFGLAAVGALSGIVRRRLPVISLTACALGVAAAFVLVPEGRLWNARLLPFWFLCIYLLAGAGVASTVTAVREGAGRIGRIGRLGRTASPWMVVGAALASVLFVAAPLGRTFLVRTGDDGRSAVLGLSALSADPSYIPGWVAHNFRGYEDLPAYAEYRDLMVTMQEVGATQGCGRAMYEYSNAQEAYGTPLALMLLPHWTDGCIQSSEGLYFESSPTTPFHFLAASEVTFSPSNPVSGLEGYWAEGLDFEAGVEHLQLMGVRYYLAFTPEAIEQASIHPELTLLAKSGPWRVYEVAGSELVTGLDTEPIVVEGASKSAERWQGEALRTWARLDGERLHIVDGGPEAWARVRGDEALPITELEPVDVTDIETSTDRITFRVDEIGKPVLVKASYFPSWRASGALGPFRATPNFMVVVPTSTEVELRYERTTVDWAGWLMTFAGVAGVVLLRRRDRRAAAAIG